MIANIALRVNCSLGTNAAVDIIINVPSVKNKFFFFMLIAFNKNRIICSITYESMRKLNIYFGLIPRYPPPFQTIVLLQQFESQVRTRP